ncbi:MAG: twin-arginine translocase subunit TatC [Blastocatellia bacterium]
MTDEKVIDPTSTEDEPQEGLQMSFLDHLDELRRRLIHSAIAIAIAFVLCFAFSKQIYDFLSIPVRVEIDRAERARLQKFAGPDNTAELKEGDQALYTFPEDSAIEKPEVTAGITTTKKVRIAPGTTVPVKIIKKDDRLAAVLAQAWYVGKTLFPVGTEISGLAGKFDPGYAMSGRMTITKVQSPFTIYLLVTLYAAIALAIPFLLFQVWAFISPGLYDNEKKYILPVLFMGTVLFICGAAFGYYIAFPAACSYLLGLSDGDFQPMIEVESYLDLILIIMLGLGIIFQMPTIAFILARIGLVTPGFLLRSWRYAIVIIFIISAVLTPTADALNLMIFAVPMMMLYVLSIGIVWVFHKDRKKEELTS